MAYIYNPSCDIYRYNKLMSIFVINGYLLKMLCYEYMQKVKNILYTSRNSKFIMKNNKIFFNKSYHVFRVFSYYKLTNKNGRPRINNKQSIKK